MTNYACVLVKPADSNNPLYSILPSKSCSSLQWIRNATTNLRLKVIHELVMNLHLRIMMVVRALKRQTDPNRLHHHPRCLKLIIRQDNNAAFAV